ncbi:MAG: hypothetical protein C0625_17060 [Arcobacter sp.]|nr:MAG: hypothetical protein C0625_17060 [Arcobacter sp.]
MIKTLFISTLATFILGGCISITKELPAQKTYTLSVKEDNVKSKYFDKTIRVYEPKALSSINTKAITYSKDFEQEKYVLSKWSDKPTKIIQELTANYLTKQNSYKYITTSNIKIDADYNLVSELTSFKHTFTKAKSYADFSIRVYFINNKTDKVYFKSFTYNKQVDKNNAKGAVDSLNLLMSDYLKDLNNFIQNALK